MKKIFCILSLLCIFLFTQAQNSAIQQEMNNMNYGQALKLMKEFPLDANTTLLKVQALKGLNRYKDAIELIKQARLSDKENSQWNILLAECYKASGNTSEAIRYYQKVLAQNPDHLYAHIQLINSLNNSGDYNRMLNACNDYLKQDSSAMAYRLLGQAYEGRKNYLNAFACYNKAYKKDSTDYLSLALAAGIMNDNKQYQDVIQATEKYRLRDSTNLYVNQQNAKAHYFNQDYKTAINRYENLKKNGDHSFVTYCYLGTSYFITQDFFAAKENLDTANIIKPDDMYVLYYLARSCVRTSWKKDGLKYMNQAIETTLVSDSTMIFLYSGLLDCNKLAGSWKEEISAYKKLYGYQPYPIYLYRIGCLYYYEKDIKNYTAYLNRYLATEPKNRKREVVNGKEVFTTYDDAHKRLRDLKEDEFFKGNMSWSDFMEKKFNEQRKKRMNGTKTSTTK